MAKQGTYSADILKLLFNTTTIANVAINATSSPLTNIYVTLHTADPGVAGDQTTSEIAYTGYARVAVARTSGGWTISGTSPAQVVPVANVAFGQMTAGAGGTVTHWSAGSLSSGAGRIFYSGQVLPNIPVTNGVTPILSTASLFTES